MADELHRNAFFFEPNLRMRASTRQSGSSVAEEVHQAERTTCWHAVSGRMIAVVVCMSGSLAYAAALPGEENCVDRRSELTLTLREDASVGADYRLSQATRSFRLALPPGRSAGLHLEPAQARISDDGVVALPRPSRRFRIVVFPDPPERRWAGAWPLAFTVEGRRTAVYLPYLLPLGCGEGRVLLHGGRRVAAVVDGAYHRSSRSIRSPIRTALSS